MAMGPVLIAYLFSQRWVMSGVMRGAVNNGPTTETEKPICQ